MKLDNITEKLFKACLSEKCSCKYLATTEPLKKATSSYTMILKAIILIIFCVIGYIILTKYKQIQSAYDILDCKNDPLLKKSYTYCLLDSNEYVI